MTPAHVASIAAHFGIELEQNWDGADAVWPLREKMRGDGAIVLIKLDGGRTGPGDNGPYTVLASGGSLSQGEAIRTDAAALRDGLTHVISHYAAAVWGIPLPG